MVTTANMPNEKNIVVDVRLGSDVNLLESRNQNATRNTAIRSLAVLILSISHFPTDSHSDRESSLHKPLNIEKMKSKNCSLNSLDDEAIKTTPSPSRKKPDSKSWLETMT